MWTRVNSALFSALSMHYPQRRAHAVRTHNCRMLYHGWLSGKVSSARSRIKRCHNESWTGSHVVPRILHSILTEEGENVEKGQILWVHAYRKTSSRRRGRRVQSSVEVGSEMWICIRYKQTNKNEQKTISALYIRLFWLSISWSNCDTLQLQIYVFRDVTLCRWGRSACRFEYRCAFTFKMTELYVLLRRSVWYCYYCRHDSLLASRLKISPAQN